MALECSAMEFESSERDGAKFSGRKRPIEKNDEVAALDLFSSQLLKVSCTGDEQTPRSIAITANENRVLRMPDAGLMFKQQRSLQELLTDVHEVRKTEGGQVGGRGSFARSRGPTPSSAARRDAAHRRAPSCRRAAHAAGVTVWRAVARLLVSPLPSHCPELPSRRIRGASKTLSRTYAPT